MQKQAATEDETKEVPPATPSEAMIDIDLRDPWLAAFLAWLIPGAGHFYQRRWAKGILFFVCILGTFLYGLAIGDGKVVYASFRPQDRRLQYICQAGVGLPAMPALVQSMRVRQGKEPWGEFMAPPELGPNGGQLNEWQKNLHRYFELGTVFTMIAGLLNILAIFDAWAGPVIIEPIPDKKEKPKGKSPPDAQRFSGWEFYFALGGAAVGYFMLGSMFTREGQPSLLAQVFGAAIGALAGFGCYLLVRRFTAKSPPSDDST